MLRHQYARENEKGGTTLCRLGDGKILRCGKRSEIWASEEIHLKESSKQADILWICFLFKNLHRVRECLLLSLKTNNKIQLIPWAVKNTRTVVIQRRIIQGSGTGGDWCKETRLTRSQIYG